MDSTAVDYYSLKIFCCIKHLKSLAAYSKYGDRRMLGDKAPRKGILGCIRQYL